MNHSSYLSQLIIFNSIASLELFVYITLVIKIFKYRHEYRLIDNYYFQFMIMCEFINTLVRTLGFVVILNILFFKYYLQKFQLVFDNDKTAIIQITNLSMLVSGYSYIIKTLLHATQYMRVFSNMAFSLIRAKKTIR